MKKWLALLMACMMLMGCACASAEEFSLRNGVMFGETMEQVKAKETLAVNDELGDEHNLYTVKGTVAGISNVNLWYRFDETTGELYDVRWELPNVTSADTNDSNYDKLYDAMVKKYGKPLGFSDGNCYIITGSALSGAVTLTMLYSELFDNGVGDLLGYAEWDIDVGNGNHVKLEIAKYYYGTSYSTREYSINVGYSCFTDADLEEARQEKRNETDAVMNDI